MKFTELFEGASSASLSDIQSSCSQFLKLTHGVSIYRGTRARIGDVSYHTIRDDRKPSTTPPHWQKMINEWFQENFGSPWRSNAIFTTGARAQAEYYGKPYEVYPKDGFKYLWSPKIKDLFLYIANNHNTTSYTQMPERIKQMLDEAEYQSGDLLAAIRSGHEIMIQAPGYYMVNPDSNVVVTD